MAVTSDQPAMITSVPTTVQNATGPMPDLAAAMAEGEGDCAGTALCGALPVARLGAAAVPAAGDAVRDADAACRSAS